MRDTLLIYVECSTLFEMPFYVNGTTKTTGWLKDCYTMTETHLTCVVVRTVNKTLCRLIIKGNTTTIRMQDHAVHKVLHIKFVSLMTNVASQPDFISLLHPVSWEGSLWHVYSWWYKLPRGQSLICCDTREEISKYMDQSYYVINHQRNTSMLL